MGEMQTEEIEALFDACDLNLSGFIEKEELGTLCSDLELTDAEFDEIFSELDRDGDGKISKTDFREGFKSVSSLLMKKKCNSPSGSPLLRARTFSFEDSEGSKMEEDEMPSSKSASVSDTSAKSKSSLSMTSSVKSSRGTKTVPGSKSPRPSSGRSTPRRKASKNATVGPDKNMEIFEKIIAEMDSGYYQLNRPSQEQLCEFYQQLHHAEVPHLLALFENVIVSMIKDIRQHQYENERLEKSYNKEKESHSRHLRQLEEEMEVQMARVEARVRTEEKERTDSEKDELRNQLETEIGELRSNLSRLQKLDAEVTRLPSDETKARLDELSAENRQLKSAFTDAQTNLALLRSEIANIRQQYEEKRDELECEKENLVEYIKEHDSLTRQVHLLQDANKKLHDTNDDLRAAIETARGSNKRTYLHRKKPVYVVVSNRSMRNRNSLENMDMINAYMTSPPGLHRSHSFSANSSLADELNMSMDGPVRKLLPNQESCEVDNNSLAGDIDSGHSTMSTLRDIQDIESEYEVNSFEDEYPRKSRRIDSICDSEIPEFLADEVDIEVDQIDSLNSNALHSINMDLSDVDEVDGLDLDEHQLAEATNELSLEHLSASSPRERSLSPAQRYGAVSPRGRSLSPRPGSACSHCSECSRSSSRSGSRQREYVTSASQQTTQRQPTIKRQLPQIPKPITGEPERMYKVVLAGDAAVGKSSFIMRLCKNKFVPNLNSTLGVDFQTKVLEVDGRVIALQLWDTAGQERFRSIAKSYFRRADGVLLLYDSTYERSFLNVRDWMQSIEDGAQKKIPIMLCGNKVDLRDEYQAEGKRCVKTEDGQKLARDVEGLFIETSAKEGDNILEAVTELARMLRTNEDIEVKTAGLTLQDMKADDKKKLGPSCCN